MKVIGPGGEVGGGQHTHSCWRSSCGLGSGMRCGVVHYVSSRTAADYLPPAQIHAHPSAAPTSVVAHAVRGDHGGHL